MHAFSASVTRLRRQEPYAEPATSARLTKASAAQRAVTRALAEPLAHADRRDRREQDEIDDPDDLDRLPHAAPSSWARRSYRAVIGMRHAGR